MTIENKKKSKKKKGGRKQDFESESNRLKQLDLLLDPSFRRSLARSAIFCELTNSSTNFLISSLSKGWFTISVYRLTFKLKLASMRRQQRLRISLLLYREFL